MTKQLRAYIRGRKARTLGKSGKSNPYPANTSERTQWNIGYCT